MSIQNKEPNHNKDGQHLNVSEDGAAFITLITEFLNEDSTLKKSVNHEDTTLLAAFNTIMGAALTSGSLEEIEPLYNLFSSIIIQQLQLLAIKYGWNKTQRKIFSEMCNEFQSLHPFAHRTTVQGMLNGHKKKNTDQWLGKSFQQNIEKLEAVGYKPDKVSVNLDPHFTDFKPNFKNGEIRQILIGGRTTLKTGYQLNLTNITPIGLYNAIDLAPKRQKDCKDLGDLRYALTFGKAFERLQAVDIQPANGQADRGLCRAGLFAISQKCAWPTTSGEIGKLANFLDSTFLFTPWKSTRKTKTDLILEDNFSEIMISTSHIPRDQYAGGQELVRYAFGTVSKCKIPISTVILTVQRQKGKQKSLKPTEVQQNLQLHCRKLEIAKNESESLKDEYLSLPSANGRELKPKGLLMKLNNKKKSLLGNETQKAWEVRKKYKRTKQAIKRFQTKKNDFLREFQVFEIGVGEPFLSILKGPHNMERRKLIAHLKKLCSQYSSRWCIESGFEMIECHFPLNYKGRSSDTHVRVFTLQSLIYNDFRVAQIKRIGATKPYNWRPVDPRDKSRCRRFTAAEQRMYSTRTYLLEKLGESLDLYFCRTLV